LSKYHKILGVKPGVTLAELKKAFRKKAMLLHPDVNDSPNAKQEFIQLKLAYEYLSSPRRKVIPKAVKKKATHKQKRKAYAQQKAKQNYKQQSYNRRTNHKKDIERLDWNILKQDLLRVFKAFLGASILASLFFTILILPSISLATYFKLILGSFAFFGGFAIIIYCIIFVSYLPDIMSKIIKSYKK
jgi:Flp pilus assembly protein TadB